MRKLLGVFLAILLTAIPFALADDIAVTADVQKYISVTFNYATVPYATLTAGTNNNTAPDQASGVYNATVDTNFAYDVKANGTAFSDGAGHTFNVNNLRVDTNSTAGDLAVGSAVALSGAPQAIDSYAYTVTDNFHGFWLSIPAAQYPASYSSTVTVSYSNQ
jgi:hypothetical protein